MGWMDKAKKLADQAQTKLDEVQKQFNESQGSSAGSNQAPAPVEYDQHGRPVRKDPEPPHGDPLTDAGPETPETTPAPAPAAPPTPAAAEERKPPAPPSGGGFTSGDPLAG